MKFGALVVDGRGKIGGHVASKNRAGAYLRTKVTPVNPNTSSQAASRQRLTTISQAWRGLTADERASWNGAVVSYSKTDIFGDIKSPTGFNLYQRLNNNLSLISVSNLDSAPVVSPVSTTRIGALTIDVGAGDASTIATAGAVPAGTSMIVRATPSLSPGVNFVQSEYRIIEIFAAGSASPHDIQSSYEAKFGAPAAGQKVFVEIFFINQATGQASQRQSTSTIVVST